MAESVVFAVGADRPGIVAAVTGTLYDLGANLLDTSMTVLSGHFAVVLVVEGPDAASVERALAPVAAPFGLTITVRGIDAVAPRAGAARHVVSVYGADRPGIVARVTAALAERDVNVVDLHTRRVGDPDDPVYAMVLEVVLPPAVAEATLAEAMRTLADDVGVDVHVHAVEADIL